MTERRTRPPITLTLSISARERLAELTTRTGQTASRLVESWILAAEMPRRPPRVARELLATAPIGSPDMDDDIRAVQLDALVDSLHPRRRK